jgi:hypothetical protein
MLHVPIGQAKMKRIIPMFLALIDTALFHNNVNSIFPTLLKYKHNGPLLRLKVQNDF